MKNVYAVRMSFTDRKEGPGSGRVITVQTSNVPRAIAQASREFWKHLTTKQRNDVRRCGLKAEARKVQ